MFTLKHLVVLFFLQNTVFSQYDEEDSCETTELEFGGEAMDYNGGNEECEFSDCDCSEEPLNAEETSTESPENYTTEYPENYITENPENYTTENLENYTTENPENDTNEPDYCPNDQSRISLIDIKYSIKENAEMLKIKQKFENSSIPKANELLNKYMVELGNFLNGLIERPNHMKHILEDVALLRKKLVPKVDKIVSQLEQFNILEDDMKNVAKRSNMALHQLEQYKNLCLMNCQSIDFRNQFNDPFLVFQFADTYCISLRDLNSIINKKISEMQEQNYDSLYHHLEDSLKNYTQKITEFTTNLKNTTVKEFGMIMYDILTLQDNYYHLEEYLEQVNISSQIYNIQKNIAKIRYRLIGLDGDMLKFRESCLKCVINRRTKRNVLDFLDSSTLHAVQERFDSGVESVVTELIKDEIDEIKESIKINFTSTFEELDKQLNDSKSLDDTSKLLNDLRVEIEGNVKLEQDAFQEFRGRISKESIDTILDLSKQSLYILQSLEAAKQFITDHFTPTNYD